MIARRMCNTQFAAYDTWTGGILIWNDLSISRMLLLHREHFQRNLPQIIRLGNAKETNNVNFKFYTNTNLPTISSGMISTVEKELLQKNISSYSCSHAKTLI